MSRSPRHAYIDESRLRIGQGPENLYVMAAGVVAAVDVLDIQQRLRDLLPRGLPRLHFRNDRPALRRKHLEFLAQLQWRFGRPLSEPLLWIPDAIAGVVGRAHIGRDARISLEVLPDGLRQRVWAGEV